MTDPGVPDGMVPLQVGGATVGWVRDTWHERLLEPPTPFAAAGDAVVLAVPTDGFDARTEALARWAGALHARVGIPGWRDERCVVFDDARPLFAIERALLRPLGLRLRSALACAWSDRVDGPAIWVARRADTKPVDPGLLDVLVGGGIAGFDDAWSTMVRECAEEAGLPEAVARTATPAGTLELCHAAVDDGLPVLHREHVTLYELRLPPGVVPRCADGEHQSIVAMSPAEAIASIEGGGWTRDGAQATLDLIARRGWRA